MIGYSRKLLAIFLFVLLQGFAPLLHAHFDTGTHGLSGVHQHETVALYCLDDSACPEAKIEALDTQALTATLANKLSDSADSGMLPFSFPSGQAQTFLAAIPPPSITVERWPFASPLTHAPPLF